MYTLNFLVALPFGLANLLVRKAVRGLMGVPGVSAVFFGMPAGAVPLAFGLAGVIGLCPPLDSSPVFGLQAL